LAKQGVKKSRGRKGEKEEREKKRERRNPHCLNEHPLCINALEKMVVRLEGS